MIPSLTRPLTVFDVESTGVNPATDRIVQIAILRLHPDGRTDKYQSLVNPTVPIPADATAVHGITDDMVKDAPTFRQIAPRLIKAFQNADFCGFNLVRFDLPLVREEFKRAGISTEVSDGVAPPCILDAYVLWVKQETRTLSDAVRRFLKREHAGAHDALADVEATLEVVQAQLAEWADLPRTVAELHQVLFPRDPNAVDEEGKVVRNAAGRLCLSFGKHRNVPIEQIPRSYLSWLLGTDLPADARRIIKEAA